MNSPGDIIIKKDGTSFILNEETSNSYYVYNTHSIGTLLSKAEVAVIVRRNDSDYRRIYQEFKEAWNISNQNRNVSKVHDILNTVSI